MSDSITKKFRSLPKRLNTVRDLIQSAGNTIGSVHFEKRASGNLRKMSYRLHTQKPSTARKPSGAAKTGTKATRKIVDNKNLQMTVLDVNKVVRNKEGNILGRGAWRTIPLEKVRRISVRGRVYNIVW